MFSTKTLAAAAVACTFLAGCAGLSQTPSTTQNLPQSVTRESTATTGTGVWGVSVADSVYVELGSNPAACSGSPSACNTWAEQKSFKANLATSDAYGAASLKSVTALGSITALGKAASSGKGEISSGAGANSGWEDTFTFTSKTLPAGTPVSFTASITVTSKPFNCSSAGGASLSISSFSGLSFQDTCPAGPPPVLTTTVNGEIGGTFYDGVALYLGVYAGTPYAPGQFASGNLKVAYHLTPVTAGAAYITASGKQYP